MKKAGADWLPLSCCALQTLEGINATSCTAAQLARGTEYFGWNLPHQVMAGPEARGSPGSAPAPPAPNHAPPPAARTRCMRTWRAARHYAAIVASSSVFFHDAKLLSICVWQVYSFDAIRPGM